MHSSSPVRTTKLQLTAEQQSTGECWIPAKKIPYIQGQRRSPSKMIEREKSHLESNPMPARNAWRAQIKPCAQQEILQRLSQSCLCMFECLLWRYRPCRGSGCRRPGYGISPLARGCHQLHHRATRTYTGLRKKTLGGHKQKLMCTRNQKKGAVTLQETDPDLPVHVQDSLLEAWVSGSLLGL